MQFQRNFLRKNILYSLRLYDICTASKVLMQSRPAPLWLITSMNEHCSRSLKKQVKLPCEIPEKQIQVTDIIDFIQVPIFFFFFFDLKTNLFMTSLFKFQIGPSLAQSISSWSSGNYHYQLAATFHIKIKWNNQRDRNKPFKIYFPHHFSNLGIYSQKVKHENNFECCTK